MLSDSEKRTLISRLKQSLEHEPEDDGSRFYILFKAAKELCGPGILTSSRLPESVRGRKLIIYQMRKEGFPLQVIGKYLHRHHTSVLHLQREMQTALDYPQAFRREAYLWKAFQEKIKEYETHS